MTRPLFDSEYLFGIHEPGGEGEMSAAGRPGWIVFTEGIGHDPDDYRGVDYSRWSRQGFGIISRLNNGYEPQGTIPYSRDYADFARRCANFVANSQGCKIWIIGNEMNYAVERPQVPRPAIPQFPRPSAGAAPDAAPDGELSPDEITVEDDLAGEHKLPTSRGGLGGWLARLFDRFLQGVSGGMGDASLGKPVPPHKPPATPGDLIRAQTTTPDAPLPPLPDQILDEADPLKKGDPARFSALHPVAEDEADAPGGDTGPFGILPLPSAAPRIDGREVITPDKYVECYRRCRDAIHSVPGHADDLVLVGAVAPWNNQTTYPSNPAGDWVNYFRDILLLLGPSGCDGFTLHTYTHGADANLIRSDQTMDPPFDRYHYHFRAYQDFMFAVPNNMRHLPVYITETDEDVAWEDRNIGWVQQAYGEIDWWNRQVGNQQIRALVLYRWPRFDKWYIDGKQGVIADFRQALQNDYKWKVVTPPPADFTAGMTLKTLDIVNLRRTPGFVDKPDNDIVAELAAGTLATVLSSQFAAADNLTWWHVVVLRNGAELRGWLAQTATTGVPLLSPVDESSAGAEPGPVQVGAAIQTLDVVRLRQTPGYVAKPPADVITNLSLNQPGTVVAGPVAKDELIWWEIRTIDGDQNGLQGWVAEFDPTGARLIESTGDGPESPAQGGTEVPGGSEAPGSESLSAFRIGDAVVTLDYVRLRKSPGYVGKDADDVVADLAINTPGTVRGGPQQADDLTWWRVDTTAPDGRAVNGWAAQSAPNGADLLRLDDNPPSSGQEPAPGVGGPGRFDVADRLVTLDFVRFRRTPGYVGKEASDLIQDVPPRATAIVLGGPVEMDGLTWWQVRVPLAGAEGWMAEMSPTGLLLLSPELGSRPPDDSEFVRGELVQAADALRVRQSPGTENKPADDVLGEFAPQTTLNIIDGPRTVDGLTWWQVGGISLLQGELVGWVAQAAANGTTLMQRAAQLPGTNIPDRDAGRYLTAPFRGRFGIAQLWGENQAIYNNFHYDGVALKGHNGIDFLTPIGVELQAVDDGVVADAVIADPTGFGNFVKVQHKWGESIYAHMDSIAVQPGASVRAGELLGRSGNTGFSQGPHLHFSIRINPYLRTDGWGGFSDPLPYLNPRDVQLPGYVYPQPAADLAPQFAPRPRQEVGTGMAPDQPGVPRP